MFEFLELKVKLGPEIYTYIYVITSGHDSKPQRRFAWQPQSTEMQKCRHADNWRQPPIRLCEAILASRDQCNAVFSALGN